MRVFSRTNMKRLLIAIMFSLTLVAGAVAVPVVVPVATAQTSGGGGDTGATDQGSAAATDKAVRGSSEELGWGMAAVMTRIMQLFAWLVGVAAITLENAVYFTVVRMGTVVNQLTAIGVVWRILRDIGNILLVFGFIAVGINVILDTKWYGSGYKMLPMLLLAAVTLNFSLFASEAVIDVGNLFATQFYTQINGGVPADMKGYSADLGIVEVGDRQVAEEGISNKLMAQLGLQRIYGGDLNSAAFQLDGSLIVGFMAIILFLIVAMTLFTIAFILIARFVTLIMLIMFSPIGFVGMAVPQLSGQGKKWWDQLFKQTVTAPILLLGLYVALAVITDPQFLAGFSLNATPDWLGYMHGENLQGFGGLLLSYLVAMGLLLAVAALGKSLGAVGAGKAMQWAGAASFGATAYAMNAGLNSTGRLARYGINRSGSTSTTARYATRVARLAENARVDLRQAPGVRAGLTAGGAGSIAAPVRISPLDQYRAGEKWWKDSGKEAEKKFDEENRMNLMRPLIADGKWSEAGKILNKMSDDEFTSDDTIKMINDNPDLILQLSSNKIEKIVKKVVFKKDGEVNTEVLEKMTATQLEAIRRNQNIDQDSIKKIGQKIMRSEHFLNYFKNLKEGRQKELQAAWGGDDSWLSV